MKRFFIIAALLAFSYLEANVSLSNLIECDRTTCLEELNNASDAKLWDALLEGQVKLFAGPEFLWIAQSPWWQKAENILDIGSGNGAYLDQLSNQFQEKTFKGVEKLPQLVTQASDQHIRSNLIFQEGDAEIFDPQLAESVDIVLFRFTLQHLKDSTTALKNAAKYLSSNGYVFIIDSCDVSRRTSHCISAIDDALQLVAEVQKSQGKGNRKVTLKLLQAITTENTELSNLYEIVFSNLDIQGDIVHDNVRVEGKQHRLRYFNHCLLFLTLLHRTYHIPVDLEKAYDELKGYLHDENAWTSPGTHLLVLKKKKNSSNSQ